MLHSVAGGVRQWLAVTIVGSTGGPLTTMVGSPAGAEILLLGGGPDHVLVSSPTLPAGCPHPSAVRPTLGVGIPTLGVGIPNLGVGIPNLGGGSPNLGGGIHMVGGRVLHRGGGTPIPVTVLPTLGWLFTQ